jgi:hypothetical protein
MLKDEGKEKREEVLHWCKQAVYTANEHLVKRVLRDTGAAAMRTPPFNKGTATHTQCTAHDRYTQGTRKKGMNRSAATTQVPTGSVQLSKREKG